ncbi:MAG: hypothetical protein AAF414_13215 [Pseudomonadota bacterium]
MVADRLGSAWIAGFAVWAVMLAGFSIADKVEAEMMTPQPAVQVVDVVTPQSSFEYDRGVHYWQEDRDEPVYTWPNQAVAM